MSTKYVIGIDLGTTNCVLAYSLLDQETPTIQILSVAQVTGPGTMEEKRSLPSYLFLASEHEQDSGTYDMPWAENRSFAVGEVAKQKSAETPDRTVNAAKSWLCHHRVDRRQPILPWNAPDEVAKISPVTASQRYLEHLIDAWNFQFADDPLDEQQIVLTVPASFDPVARELTREAALAAGLPSDFLLLEEPQAALYAWLNSTGDQWRKELKVGDSILVCDVGGGTTDLSLIRVTESDGDLELERVAVGDHLLVGGDNMDLTLAHHAAGLFAEKGVNLNPWQAVSLWHSCRNAKELLLAQDGPQKQQISVLGRGSKVIGGTVSVDLKRDDAMHILVDGFLPKCKLSERPQRQRVSGFQEIGLPFESEPAITRHLAAFLKSQVSAEEDVEMPNRVLFNGGVFKAIPMRERLLEVLSGWSKKKPLDVLQTEDSLDHAVAQGAAYYAWAKEHGGVRIRGGVARSYYVGIETSGLAIPGAPRPLNALCVVPMGMEEGTEANVASNEIGLVLGEPTQFRFFCSTNRKEDQPGVLLSQWDDGELTESNSLEANLPLDDSIDDNYVPVKFISRITELGMFELWCKSAASEKEWKLEFNVRDEDN